MAKREILICGDPVLRRKARPCREIGQEVADLLEDMVEAMLEVSGVGLAAPQVGAPLQAIVVREDAEPECAIHRLLNPRIVEAEGEQVGREGCLSLPTLYGHVARPDRVLVCGVNPQGEEVQLEGEGLLARALAHEIDHLRGKLFIDRAEPGSLAWLIPDPEEEDGLRWEEVTPQEALEALERLRQKRQSRGG